MSGSYTILALTLGFAADMVFGDPSGMPHVVVAMGKAIAWLEKALRGVFPKTGRGEAAAGTTLVAVMVIVWFAVPYFVLSWAARAHPALRLVLESFICYQVLAARCLRDAGMAVYDALVKGDLPGARTAVGMIVGRDTAELDAPSVIRAAVETVAENTSDGVVAPMIYFAIGGAPLALLYKAINTMDSMLGYKNDTYLHFGRAAARLDDVANYLPARLTALLMLGSAFVRGFNWRHALVVYRRDRNAHASPNAGHPESVCAGALGIVLGGNSVYGGRLVRKPALGDPLREVDAEDIRRTTRLMYGCAFFCFATSLLYLFLKPVVFEGAVAWM